MGWKRVRTKEDAVEYLNVLSPCREVQENIFATQLKAPGFEFWLYTGDTAKIGFGMRYVPIRDYIPKFFEFHAVGMDFVDATTIFRAKLEERMNAIGQRRFRTSHFRNDIHLDKIAAIRRVFADVITSDVDYTDKTRIEFDRDRDADRNG